MTPLPPRPPSLLLQVVHLYLAVVDAGDRPVELHERSRAISLARQWAPDDDADAVEAVVDTAYVAVRAGTDVEKIAREVVRRLQPADCLRLLADLGRMAKADGHLSLHEARTIAAIRAAFAREQRALAA